MVANDEDGLGGKIDNCEATRQRPQIQGLIYNGFLFLMCLINSN